MWSLETIVEMNRKKPHPGLRIVDLLESVNNDYMLHYEARRTEIKALLEQLRDVL